MQQARIGIGLRVFPFIFPDRERLDADARFQKYVVSQISHSQLSGDKLARATMQEHGHIGVAVRPMGLSCPAAKEDGAGQVIPARHLLDEGASRVGGFPVDVGD